MTFPNNQTTRRFPRDMRSAFREWPENCLGITGPVVIRTRAPWWVRAIRWLFR